MSLNFPSSPAVGQTFPSPPVSGFPVYTWDGEKWTTQGGAIGTGYAPIDSPLFINDPRAPTQPPTDNDNSLATTAYVTAAIAAAVAGLPPIVTAGTKMLFVQPTAPTGWTKDTDFNDSALRLVSGSTGGALTLGTVTFSTLFARTAVDGHVLTIPEIPSHDHPSGFVGGAHDMGIPGGHDPGRTGFTGGDQPHIHTLDMRVHYVDVIKATKN